MLADWAHSEIAQRPVLRLLRICFSFFLAIAWSANANLAFACGHEQGASRVTAADLHGQSTPIEQAVVTPQAEGSELYPPTSLRFDAEDSAFIFWQPATLASSRIVPQGLVLSFLCDSARHQCSGVQLA